MSGVSTQNQQVIEEFRANEGALGGAFGGASLLILHTTGSRTGLTRVTPLMYQRVGNDLAVFATNMGSRTHPAWFGNLLAHPDAVIEIGNETVDVHSRVAEGEERDRIWEIQKQENPMFADHETAAADRQIPVVILTRR